MKKFLIQDGFLPAFKASCAFLAAIVLLCLAACSDDSIADTTDEPLLPGSSQNQTGVLPIDIYVIYRLSGDYSDNVPVMFDKVVLGKNGERQIYGSIVGIPDNREDGKSPVRKLNDGFYYSGWWGQSPYDVYLTLKYSDYKTTDDLDKADRPDKYGYAVIPEARVTESYGIGVQEFWRIAEELFPEDKEEYGHYWGNMYMTDTFEKTMNSLIADGLPGFELVYDETTYDPATAEK